jgi:hypothetical protein
MRNVKERERGKTLRQIPRWRVLVLHIFVGRVSRPVFSLFLESGRETRPTKRPGKTQQRNVKAGESG